MNGNWLRVTPAELERATTDEDWVYDMADAAEEAGDDRWLSVGKTWQGLDYLLTRQGVGIPIVLGAHEIDEDDPEAIRYLTVEQVAAAAAELARLDMATLVGDLDPADLDRAEIYPGPWRAEDLTWTVHFLPDVTAFFATAAASGEAVLCWIN